MYTCRTQIVYKLLSHPFQQTEQRSLAGRYWEVGGTAPYSGGVCEWVHQSIAILICGDVFDIVNLVDYFHRACDLYCLQADGKTQSSNISSLLI